MAVEIEKQTHSNAVIWAQDNTLFLTGDIDDLDPGLYLTPFFNSARQQMGDALTIDFTRLDFLNSSGIKCIVSFVMEKPPSAHLTFVTDPGKTWQLTSFEVIQSLDEDHIRISEKPMDP